MKAHIRRTDIQRFWLALFSFSLLLFGALPSSAGNSDTTPQNSRVPTVVVQSESRLLGLLERQGSVRVIVRLRVPVSGLPAVVPEASLPSARRRLARRQAIAEVSQEFLRRMAGYRMEAVRKFDSIPFLAVEVGSAGFERLKSSPLVESVQEDRLLAPALAQSIPLVGADTAWSQGYSGAGQVVAILDTGVDATHPFLNGKVVAEACFSSNTSDSVSLCPNGQNQQTGSGAAAPCASGCDHGTHVAGIAAGNGEGLGRESGVARDADIAAVQVFSHFPTCSGGGAPAWADSSTGGQDDTVSAASGCVLAWESDIIAGLLWVYDLAIDTGAGVDVASVNMSLGGSTVATIAECDSVGDQVIPGPNVGMKAAIDNLRLVDVATVVASGNNGKSNEISYPGCISSAVSVGSSTDVDDVVSGFSNGASWLSLLAPGEYITSSVPGGGYANWRGTSMATPHVAGAWAVIKSRVNDATVDQVLAALTRSGVLLADSRNGMVFPRMQLDAALSEFVDGVPYPENIIVDNDDAPNSFQVLEGSFSSIVDPKAYGGVALRSDTQAAATIRVVPSLPYDGIYRIYSYWPGADAASERVEYRVAHDAGVDVIAVNQGVDGGLWRELGLYRLVADGSADVTIGGVGVGVEADALRFESVAVQDVPPLSLGAELPPRGAVDLPYQFDVSRPGGVAPYIYTFTGDLPPGLSFDPQARSIHGVPLQAGTYSFNLSVQDSSLPAPSSVDRDFVITIEDFGIKLLLSADNAFEAYINGVLIGEASDWQQAQELFASLHMGKNILAIKGLDAGGVAGVLAELQWSGEGSAVSDISWRISTVEQAGWEAEGFDDTTWAFASSYGGYGVGPWGPGVVGFPGSTDAEWIWSVDNEGDDTVYLRYTIDLGDPALHIATSNLPNAVLGQSYQQTLVATNGQPPYSWSLSAGSLQDGLALGADGAINGVPTTEQTALFTVEVLDQAGAVATQDLSLQVVGSVPDELSLKVAADNSSKVYLNGELLGASSNWQQALDLSAGLRDGLNVVAIEGVDAGGVAGLLANLSWTGGNVAVSDAGWKVSTVAQVGWETLGFNDVAWRGATEYGNYGVAPWGMGVVDFPSPTSAKWIWSADNDGDDTVYFRYSFTIGPEVLGIATESLPDAVVGQSYQQTLLAVGGQAPYTWVVTAGSLPDGMTFSSDGTLGGTSAVEQTASFTVQVTDQGGAVASKDLSILVAAVAPQELSLRVTADNASEVYLNGVLLGATDDWQQALSLSAALRDGLNVIAIQGIDAGGVAGLLADLSWTGGNAAVSDSSWKVSVVGPVGWQDLGFDDAAWLAASEYGGYGVAPWGKGVADFPDPTAARWIWSADNDADDTVYFRYTFNIGAPVLSITTGSLPNAIVGQAYQQALLAADGQAPYTWSLIAGNLPDGMTLDSDGSLSGISAIEQTASFTVQVVDQGGAVATKDLSIVVAAVAPQELSLQVAVDNASEVYLNGVLLGTTDDWQQALSLSAALRDGLNVVAVKGVDEGGVAGLLADLSWTGGNAAVSDSAWKVSTVEEAGWTGLGFDDGSWAAATVYGGYGVAPWGKGVVGFPSATAAQWIWSDDYDGDDVVYFRYSFTVDASPP